MTDVINEAWIERALQETRIQRHTRTEMIFAKFSETEGNREALKASLTFVSSYQSWKRGDGGNLEPRPFLLLYSRPGTGKTHLCHAIIWQFIEDGDSCLYYQAEEMFDDLRASYDKGIYDHRMRRIKNVTLLVIDDVGAQTETEWAMAKLDMIFDFRYRLRLPTIITTNTLDLPARIIDRLKEGRIVQIKGESWRGKHARKAEDS